VEDNFFECQAVSSMSERSPYILNGQVRIGIQEVSFFRSLAKLSDDQLNRDTGASDHRLAHHDLGVYLNTVVKGHFCTSSGKDRHYIISLSFFGVAIVPKLFISARWL
jgi:hypothetical protein